MFRNMSYLGGGERYIIDEKCTASLKQYRTFKSEYMADYLQPKGSKDTNFIDIADGQMYCLPDNIVPRLMDHLNECFREGATLHVNERQTNSATVYSGIMIDVDLKFHTPTAVSEGFSQTLMQRVATHLKQIVDIPAEFNTVFFLTARPEPRKLTENGGILYRTGVHLIIPGVRITPGTKKYLLRKLEKDRRLEQAVKDSGHVGDLEGVIDQGSASVPVFCYGSCKIKNGQVYKLIKTAQVDISDEDGMIAVSEIKDLHRYNLIYEMSILHQAMYDDHTPLLIKHDFECKPELAHDVQDLSDRTRRDLISREEEDDTENEAQELTMHNPDAKIVQSLLKLLDASFHKERNKWRNVVFALANYSMNTAGPYSSLKPLGKWFSQKCPEKWKTGGSEEFERLWDEGVQHQHEDGCITIRSIHFWAKNQNPEKYKAIINTGHKNYLQQTALSFEGNINHWTMAKLLEIVFGYKFVSDYNVLGRIPMQKWYEFVLPGETNEPGEVWKWRESISLEGPAVMSKYLSETGPQLVSEVINFVKNCQKDEIDETKSKWFDRVTKNLNVSKGRMGDHPFKANIFKEARVHFERQGFISKLDKDGDLMGVGNGILKLGKKCKLINSFHEYLITKFTPNEYRPFDPEDPTAEQAEILRWYADFIPEPDARERILMYLSTGLDGNFKEPILLLVDGGGQNGKSSITLFWKNTLSDKYATKLNMSLLTSTEKAPPDRPNSALMALKEKRGGFFDESKQLDMLNTTLLKEIVNPGEVSCSEKFQKQETFEVVATLIALTNFMFVINTSDHGTWRRLWRYNTKTTFKPNPQGLYELKEDKKFAETYVKDRRMLEANLSILVYFYERLQNEYDGDVRKVPSPTIERETEDFRNTQDVTNQFITSMVVTTGDETDEIDINVLSSAYMAWLKHPKRNMAQPLKSASIEQLEKSVIQQYIKFKDGKKMIVGCRTLQQETEQLGPSEDYIGAKSNRCPPMTEDEMIRSKNCKWWLPGEVARIMKESAAAARDVSAETLDVALDAALADTLDDTLDVALNAALAETLDADDASDDSFDAGETEYVERGTVPAKPASSKLADDLLDAIRDHLA